MRWIRNISLRYKLVLVAMLTSTGALLLAAGGFMAYDLMTFRRYTLSQLNLEAEIVAQSSTAALEFNDRKPIDEILAAVKADPHLVAAVVYDAQDKPFASYIRENLSASFTPPAPQNVEHVFEGNSVSVFRRIAMDQRFLGTVYLRSDIGELKTRSQRYAGIAGLVLLASIVAALLLCAKLQSLISNPIFSLSVTARRVALEKNYALRAPKSGEDEVGQLVDGFNEMLTQIQSRDVALRKAQDELELRVEERTRELKSEVGERRRAEEALRESQSLYSSLVEHLPIWVFRKDAEGRFTFANSLFCKMLGRSEKDVIGSTDIDFVAPESAAKYAEDDAKVLRDGVTLDVEETLRNTRGELLHVHTFKVPVYGSDGTIKGTQGCVVDITDRKRMEQALAYERELMHTLMENSPDHIYFKDTESRFLKCSKALATRLGLKSPEEVVGKSDMDLFREDYARPAIQEEKRIVRTGVPVIGKVERQPWKDETVSWMLTTRMPFRDKAGNIVGTFGISKDITELKRAESELEEVHRKLVESSRNAGMAEVATGVLHNVGNVLNSVNVSANLISDIVRKSKVTGVGKAVGLLRENGSDLATFFNTGNRAQQFTDYLSKLGDHLGQEQSALLNEVALLSDHIEHIKEIVVMQQGYAKSTGLREPLTPKSLVDDALRINSAALARHDVHVSTDIDDTPRVVVDRHKVLQILINLVSNAKYALDDGHPEAKELRISVRKQGNHVRFCVEDNGIGISSDNLTRIFQHGFTTRKTGHGFGLHSSALAAKELGGSLRAYSEGPGRGARFVLNLLAEVPITEPQEISCIQ